MNAFETSALKPAAPCSAPQPPAAEIPRAEFPGVTPPATLLPVWRHFARFAVNPLTALPRQVYEEPFVCYRKGWTSVVWVTHPDLTRRILLDDAECFLKTPMERRVLGPTLGQGILMAEGEAWRWQRKIVAPLFRLNELSRYVPAMVAAAEAQAGRWREKPPGHIAAIDKDMTATAFAVITSTILSGCTADEAEALQRTNEEFLTPVSWALAAAMLGLPPWLWHPGKGRMKRAAEAQRRIISGLIARERANGDPGGSGILGRLLAARDPATGAPMPGNLVVDNMATFITAGHETTAKALTWTLYILARIPFWQQAVREEVRRVAGEGAIGAEEVSQLTLTTQVIKESLRLYPAAPVLTRITANSQDLGGTSLPKGTLIVIPIYAVHRHRALWSEPACFDPGRFHPGREKSYPRTQYMPFGAGARTCIGGTFALLEAVTLLAHFIRSAHFEWRGQREPEPVSRVTLRPKGGMPLAVTPI